jgi:hypothetical protein
VVVKVVIMLNKVGHEPVATRLRSLAQPHHPGTGKSVVRSWEWGQVHTYENHHH